MRGRPAFALGALLLLAGCLAVALAGSAAAQAKKSAAKARPARGAKADTVLARVGGQPITRADVERRLAELPEPYRQNYATPEGRQQFLERMVEERVWLLGAKKHGVDTRPELRRQLEQAERDLLIRTYVNEIMSANPAPSDSDAKIFYDAHQVDYRTPATVTLSHILLKNEAEARRVRQMATAPKQDWKKLVARFSADSATKAHDGELGTVTREGIFASIGAQPALAESAFALGTAPSPAGGPGTIGGPYKTDRGWHVIKVESAKPEGTRPFEQVRSLIMRQLGQTRSQDYYKARLAIEKATLQFTVDSAAVKEFISQKKTAQELFKEGQESTSPTVRIAAYRRLLEEYPDSEVSPQAQFMLGFIYSEELKNYDEAEKAFRDLLRRYPKSELTESARWMVDHMRSEDVPELVGSQADSLGRPSTGATKRPADKP
ncbi:MAG TPA: peptidyl-prolyl cis-trans isomerase [Candidatus Eisenbacteria bacterium]|nr:peptidyl-prolyl cis-trans isomerase [Candidatus Eisenbacteria bacterium]